MRGCGDACASKKQRDLDPAYFNPKQMNMLDLDLTLHLSNNFNESGLKAVPDMNSSPPLFTEIF